ncbi:hypothetical protein EJ05DRAFT_488599 [Pseudovirgaria hyperparasitica]|uniref:Uncharacterized protein n=1 Tax=Pseudovirgaria hyperparasitica TaxID=470096 RepID=A0A6A6W1X4_9PEZI|nr:uncharacterized protein EJ05DRAFT_488599 [Pseudovirgaria hyperparasitica]KAF2755041.1 hypothetical protein EJ05DRAFT_488599 [Pseudovirgaria hyperparasitica]
MSALLEFVGVCFTFTPPRLQDTWCTDPSTGNATIVCTPHPSTNPTLATMQILRCAPEPSYWIPVGSAVSGDGAILAERTQQPMHTASKLVWLITSKSIINPSGRLLLCTTSAGASTCIDPDIDPPLLTQHESFNQLPAHAHGRAHPMWRGDGPRPVASILFPATQIG